MPRIVYATRKSALALAQCRAFVARLVEAHGGALETDELQVVTTGDRVQDRPLAEIGGKGLFVKEIEEALLEGRAHLAVHSIKDVPALAQPGLVLACIPERESPWDALVAPRFADLPSLPPGARVGTGSLRRLVELRRARPDLEVVPLRGNVDTRLRKVDAGEYDAIVLAHAGLRRLGLGHRATSVLSVDDCLPAVGQGALGIECREDDHATRALLATLHHAETARAVCAERGVLKELEGDCKTPIGAFAVREGDTLRVRALIAKPDGADRRSVDERVPYPASDEAAEAAGRAVGAKLRG